MVGYFNCLDVIVDMFDVDGWLYIGDVVMVMYDGIYWIVDCFKEFIKYKGY